MKYRININDEEIRIVLSALRKEKDPLPGTKKLIERLEMVWIRSRSVRGLNR